MRQRADRIEAHITPEYQPDFVADAIEYRRLHAGRAEQGGQAGDVLRRFARRLADRKTITLDVLDHAGRHDLGRGIDNATDRPLGTEFTPLPPAGIDALQRRSLVSTTVLVEVPIGNAVDRRDDAGVRPDQGLHRIDRTGDGMCLQTDDDEVLRAKFGRGIGAARTNHALLIGDLKLQPIGAHRRQVRAAGDQTDVGAGTHELDPEIAAERTGAVNANLHVTPPGS